MKGQSLSMGVISDDAQLTLTVIHISSHLDSLIASFDNLESFYHQIVVIFTYSEFLIYISTLHNS